jgi:hypothetical protein
MASGKTFIVRLSDGSEVSVCAHRFVLSDNLLVFHDWDDASVAAFNVTVWDTVLPGWEPEDG